MFNSKKIEEIHELLDVEERGLEGHPTMRYLVSDRLDSIEEKMREIDKIKSGVGLYDKKIDAYNRFGLEVVESGIFGGIGTDIIEETQPRTKLEDKLDAIIDYLGCEYQEKPDDSDYPKLVKKPKKK